MMSMVSNVCSYVLVAVASLHLETISGVKLKPCHLLTIGS